MDEQNTPIFILGVPRSGTTLLRTILDSHPDIACGPETPWLCGHQPRSVMDLCQFLWNRELGYCASYDMPRRVVTAATRRFVDELMFSYARKRGKRRWAEKTPDNILYIDFLTELFPDARFIYIVRDPLDVAASTSLFPDDGGGASQHYQRKLLVGPRAWTANHPLSATLRWRRWNQFAEQSLRGHEHLRITYESLVQEPQSTLQNICAFIGEEFHQSMIRFADFQHDMPAWEWGSANVKSRPQVSPASVGRGQRELSEVQRNILLPLAGAQEPSRPEPRAAAGSLAEMRSESYTTLMQWMNQFARPLGLRSYAGWSKAWEYPWLWFNAISKLDLSTLRIIDLGSELSPLPWIMGLLGARVTIVETSQEHIALWERLRSGLRVDVDWIIATDETIGLDDASVDLVMSLSVLEHQSDKQKAISEAARILKPGGIITLSFDLCEPEMGMSYPQDHGSAMSTREFEDLIWLHPAFGNTTRPEWNRRDMKPFQAWHLKSSELHNYVVGAAVMVKQP